MLLMCKKYPHSMTIVRTMLSLHENVGSFTIPKTIKQNSTNSVLLSQAMKNLAIFSYAYDCTTDTRNLCSVY